MNVALRPGPRPLNVISICSGGGGLDLALELALPSARAVCMVEREAFAVARLVEAMHQGFLAPCPVWSDARTFAGRPWRGLVDGLVGGIPCQPHSLAGKRLAALDERDLWGATRRIIVQARPWFVLIENVGGMLSSGGGERVWRDLGRLGFSREVGLFTAAEVGWPHERERVFILAVADAHCFGLQGIGHPDPSTESGRPVSDPGVPALAYPEGLGQRRRRRLPEGQRPTELGSGHRDSALADANLVGGEARRQPRLVPGSEGRRALVKPSGSLVADAAGPGRQWRGSDGCGPGERTAAERGGGALADAGRDRCERGEEPHLESLQSGEQTPRRGDAERCDYPLSPPGPGDLARWAQVLARAPHLEPAVRRVADGVASRVDELRLLGNGVHPLEGAYAIRTLAARLARRSAGAALLAGLMEG